MQVTNAGLVAATNLSVVFSSDGNDYQALCASQTVDAGASTACNVAYVTLLNDVNSGAVQGTAQLTATFGTDGTQSKSVPVSVSATFVSQSEYGIALTFGDTALRTNEYMLARARDALSYISGLGANAVSISFPFYQVGQNLVDGAQTASAVTSGPGTPSVALLRAVIMIAQRDGLKVQLRPLLSEEGDNTPITTLWRGTIQPVDPAAWFASYYQWLLPYMELAQRTGVDSFCLAGELNSLNNDLQYWIPLLRSSQAILGNRLLFSNSRSILRTVPGAQFGTDAYNPVWPPAGTTITSDNAVSVFTAGVDSNFHKAGFPVKLSETRIEEFGIPAIDQAWTQPYNFYYPPGSTIERWVQADWVTANCNVFLKYHMRGIYFWSIFLTGFYPGNNADLMNDPLGVQGTITEDSLKSCFAAARVAAGQ